MNLGTIVRSVSKLTIILIFFWLVSTSTIQDQVLGVVLLAIILWSFYPSRHLESSILIIAILVVLQATLDVEGFISNLFRVYGGSGLWIIISGFILAKGMEVSGLGKRIALVIATSLGAKPRNILLAIAITSFAISPLSPSTTAKAFLILPICIGLVEAFGVEKGRSNFGAAVMIMAMAANNICSTAFLTATVPNPISAGYLADIGLELDWVRWFEMAFPLTILLLAISYLLLIFMFKPEVEANRNTLQKVKELREALGPIKGSEKTVAIIFSLAIVLWISEQYNPFNVGLISLLLSLVLILPQAGVMEPKGFGSSIPWGSIALFAASMFLARAVGEYHALDSVTLSLFNILNLEKFEAAILISVIVLVAMMLHIVFTSTTVYATVMVPIAIGLTQLHGLDPVLTALPIAVLAPVAIILPVNTIPNIIFYGEGWFNEKQMVIYGIILSILSVTLVLLIGIPYWRLLGVI